MNIIWKPINEVTPYQKNPRIHSETTITRIAKSIKDFGWTQPIVIDGKNIILAGHGRHLAALSLNMVQVPCVLVDDLSEAQKKAYRIIDNKLVTDSAWDDELLQQELNDLVDLDFKVDDFGLDDFLADTEPEEDQFETPDVNSVKTKIKLGDIIMLGRHKVLCGDSTIIEQLGRIISGISIGLVCSDRPYGISLNGKVGGGTDKYPTTKFDSIVGDEDTEAAKKFYSICRKLGIDNYILWGGNYYSDCLPTSRCWLVWHKNHITERTFANCELAWTSFNQNAKCYNVTWDGYVKAGESGSKQHPTQKPLQLYREILTDFNYEIVLDGFLGSGTTLIACEEIGRTCIGIEIEPKYCQVVVDRYKKYCQDNNKEFVCMINDKPYLAVESGEAE